MRAKVLLVEDQNPYLYEQLIQAQNGFEFLIVKRGDHALLVFQEHKPDLVLMDIRLPKMDGIVATRQIRSIDLTTPIIILTAYNTRDTREKVLGAGANAFFVKPFSYRLLYQRMVELIVNKQSVAPDEHIQRLIKEKVRRLNALKEKQARFGIGTPVEILLEIEDLANEITTLRPEQIMGGDLCRLGTM